MKYLKYLLILLFIPFIVYAENNIEITKIELIEKSPYVAELESATNDNLKLKFNLSFTKLNDYAKYQVILKNNTNKDYGVDNTSTFNDGEFIKYEYSIDGDKVLHANSEKTIYVTITYSKEISEDKYENNKYSEKNNVSIEFSNDEKEQDKELETVKFVTNPKTSSNELIYLIISFSIIAILFIIITKNNKLKKYMLIILMLIPITIYALEKIHLDLETYIEIEQTKIFYIATHFDSEIIEQKEYHYIDGMTIEEWMNSRYNIDNFEYDEEAARCSVNNRYLYDNLEDANKTILPPKSVPKNSIIIENNIYITGIGGVCID